MWWKAWWLTIGLAIGCTGIDSRPWTVERATKKLMTPGEAFEVLRPPFGYGGIWFPDTKCRTKFPGLGRITEDQLDEFKRCIAALDLRISARQDDELGAALLTYGPGFELEARFVHTGQSAWLRWIGYVGRRVPQDALPTISPEAFEELRIAGDPHQPLDPAARATLDRAVAATGRSFGYATLKVCIRNDGNVTVHRRRASSPPVEAGFVTAISQEWKFRPFTYGGQTIPVCVFLDLLYPFDNDKIRQLKLRPMSAPPPPPGLTAVPATTLGKRLAGNTYVTPNSAGQGKFDRSGLHQTTGVFGYCIDTTGAVTSVQIYESTGLPAYDAAIAHEIHGWRYLPYLVGEVPTAVCAIAVYVYGRHEPEEE